MFKKILYFFFYIIFIIDYVIKFITKRSILIRFNDFIQNKSYKSLNISNQKIIFFTPNKLIDWRVDSFFKKEPETLEWIDNFEKKKNLIFWDVGANIGLYSIYNSLKNPNSVTISFEPSTSNLRVLTRNISINNLFDKILVVPLPLTNKENIFLYMQEEDFIEGGALNSFGENFNFEGKSFIPKMKYNLLGTTMDYFVKNSILEIPDYIKIDVDGIEHLILQGGNSFLMDKKVKGILIEINENFTEQYKKILILMEKYNFVFLCKKRNEEMYKGKFNKIYNYIFEKKNLNLKN